MTDPFDQLFNSFFCKNNLYSFSRSNDESYGKIKLVIYGRKIMENKNNHLSPKPLFLILFILIEVLVVLILPFRFVSASVILLMNLWGVRYWLKMKRWLILNKREKSSRLRL